MTSNIRGVVVGLAFISGCAADSGRDVLAAPASSELTQAGSREQESKPDADDPPPGTTVLRGQEAFEQTVGVVAKQHGLTFDEAHAAMSFQRDFASYAEDLLSRYPNELGAIWVDPIPAKRGHVVWVGSVPKEEMAAPSGVELKGGATIPMDDQYIRVQALSETMVELGHTVHSISYEQQSQRIILQAQPDTAGKMVDLDALTTQAAARLKAIPGLGEKSAVLSPRDIDLSEGAEAMEPNSARGGNWLDVGTTHFCTSGFSVRNQSGTAYGVVTAGHCGGNLTQLEEPNGTTFRPLTWQSRAPVQYGDSQWHTTTGTVGEFYGAPNIIYGQNQYRYTNAMVGQTICGYGRASNVQNCNYLVQSVGSCRMFTAPINGQVCGLAITNNISQSFTGGDSGGPMNYSDTMYGVHDASNSTETSFTPVQGFQITLGVLVWH